MLTWASLMNKKKFLFIVLIILINGCISSNNNLNNLNAISFTNSKKTKNYDNYVFHEHLNRIFKTVENNSKMYSLSASINFETVNALSSTNSSTLKKTTATVIFNLYDLKTKKLLKTGSIKSAPAIGSTSSSLFSNDLSSKHIKERLNKNLALKLSRYLNVLILKLK